MKKVLVLATALVLVSCANSTYTEANDRPLPDTQIRKNGVYQYYISTQKANVYLIHMPNGDTCYVAEQKQDDYLMSHSLTSPSISCTK